MPLTYRPLHASATQQMSIKSDEKEFEDAAALQRLEHAAAEAAARLQGCLQRRLACLRSESTYAEERASAKQAEAGNAAQEVHLLDQEAARQAAALEPGAPTSRLPRVRCNPVFTLVLQALLWSQKHHYSWEKECEAACAPACGADTSSAAALTEAAALVETLTAGLDETRASEASRRDSEASLQRQREQLAALRDSGGRLATKLQRLSAHSAALEEAAGSSAAAEARGAQLRAGMERAAARRADLSEATASGSAELQRLRQQLAAEQAECRSLKNELQQHSKRLWHQLSSSGAISGGAHGSDTDDGRGDATASASAAAAAELLRLAALSEEAEAQVASLASQLSEARMQHDVAAASLAARPGADRCAANGANGRHVANGNPSGQRLLHQCFELRDASGPGCCNMLKALSVVAGGAMQVVVTDTTQQVSLPHSILEYISRDLIWISS